MKKKYSVEEILRILGEEKQGNKTIRNICRERNITEQTYYRWRNKYEGMELKEALRMKQLEEENRRLKQIITDQALDISILKEVNSKNGKPLSANSRSGASGETSNLLSTQSLPNLVGMPKPL